MLPYHKNAKKYSSMVRQHNGLFQENQTEKGVAENMEF